MKCTRCNGSGYIPSFSHIQEGICFACNGTGIIPDSKKGTVSYANGYLSQFRYDTYFPEDQSNIKMIHCFDLKEHPTAKFWLMEEGNFYLVGQPICRTSLYYKFPKSELTTFVKFYKKVWKKDILNNKKEVEMIIQCWNFECKYCSKDGQGQCKHKNFDGTVTCPKDKEEWEKRDSKVRNK